MEVSTFFKYVLYGALIAFLLFAAFSIFVGAGLKAAQKTRINASVPFDCKTAVKVYEQDERTGEWFSTLIENQTSPGFLEYIDRLTGLRIPHFVVPVQYNYKTQAWEPKVLTA